MNLPDAQALRTGLQKPPSVVHWLSLGTIVLLLFVCSESMGAPKLVFSSLEVEAADEFQVGNNSFGPGFLRLIGRAELALTENLTAKAMVSPCGGPYRTRPEGVTQCAVYRLIEELTLNGDYNRFSFSVGRQVVTQGNTEGFILLDRYNGRDYCRFTRLDVQNKLPNWMARGKASLGDSTSLTLTYAPFSGQSYLPQAGSYCEDSFHGLGQFSYLHDPNNNSFSDGAGGAELAFSHDRWSATLNVMSTMEDLYTLKTIPLPQKDKSRTLWVGGTSTVSLGPVIVRGEIAFSPSRDFTMTPSAAMGRLMRGGVTNGVDQRWNLLAAFGIEGRNDEWYWALQYFDDRIGSGDALVRDEESHYLSLRFRRAFLNDRIALDSFTVFDIDYSDLAIRATVSYEFNEKTTVMIGGTGYVDFDHNTGWFGSYEGRESVFVKLRRTLF